MLRFLCTAIVLLLIPIAYSSSCIPITVCSAFEHSAAVFRGRVTEVDAVVSPPPVASMDEAGTVRYPIFSKTETAQLDVLEVFKGSPGQHVSVSAPEAFFKEGDEYLVFANVDPASGGFAAGICTHTHALRSSDDPDLAWVRAYRTAPATSSIFGKLGVLGRPDERIEASVSLSGTSTATADADGNNRYSFENLPPGTYSIAANLPSGMATDAAKSVTVGPRGCAEVDWVVRYDSHVKGRVTDSAGRPLAGVPVAVLKPTNNRIGFNLVRQRKTDDQGSYDITGISPGDYWVALYPSAPSRTEPYLPVFYPFGSTPAQAKLLHLSASETIADLDLVLPPPLQEAVVHLRLLRENGTPVDGARVDAIDTDSNLGLTFFDTTADITGRADFKLYAGETYSLRATPPGEDEPCARPIKFTARDGMDLGTIVLEKSMADCRR